MKNLKAQSSIQEIIALAGTLLIAAIIIYTFYTIPTPFQSYFRNTINDMIIGVIIVAAAAGIIYFLSRF